jgi:signal transduction histidine kinase/ActR/RegA family two-component response regulator
MSSKRSGRGRGELSTDSAVFARLIENLPSAALVETPEGEVMAANRAFCQLFAGDADPEELVGRTRPELFADAQSLLSDPKGYWERVEEIVHQGRVVTRALVHLVDQRVLSLDYVPIAGEGGTAANHLWLITDVTSERQALERLRILPRMEAVGRLAGGVAHDLNNALTTILGHVSLLGLEVGNHPVLADSVSEIQKAAERAAAITRGLLAFGRRQALQPRPIDPVAVLQKLNDGLRRMVGEDIELRFDLPDEPATVRVDANKLEHALLNLAINARDSMPRGGTLSLELHYVDVSEREAALHAFPFLSGRYAMFSVADTGPGIPEDLRAKVFEPFFSTKPKEKGAGLGLSTVYGFVKQSGGYIWVESRDGPGAVFHVALPLQEGTYDPEPVRADTDAHAHERGAATILIAEDEPSVLSMVERVLEQRGYRVLAARDGVEALELLHQSGAPVDLLVTDAMMPRMGGVELASRVRELVGDLPVLVTSGYSADAVHGLDAFGGETRLLEKPFLASEVAEAVEKILADRE